MRCTYLHLWIARVWMAPCGCKERDEGHHTRIGSRVDRMNEIDQFKAEENKHPTTKVSCTNVEKIQKLLMPRGTKPWSSNAMLHLQCK